MLSWLADCTVVFIGVSAIGVVISVAEFGREGDGAGPEDVVCIDVLLLPLV